MNLGFSGSGKMELVMSELVAETDASIYVLECLGNLKLAELKGADAALTFRNHPLTVLAPERAPVEELRRQIESDCKQCRTNEGRQSLL